MTRDVFISHSSRDENTAAAVCNQLEAAGIRCWIAPRDMDVGGQTGYGANIIEAISNCSMMMVILSQHSNGSVQVMREVERAVAKGIPILPFQIEELDLSPDLEFFLSATHRLNATKGPLSQHIGTLIQRINQLRSSAARSSEPALPLTQNMPRFRHIIGQMHRRSLWQVLSIYLVGAFAGYQVILALTDGIGLPDWVPPFAIVLFIIGLPIVVATAFVQDGLPSIRPVDTTLLPGLQTDYQLDTPTPAPADRHWLTWKRSLLAGVCAFLILGLSAATYLIMRSSGIGPGASLLSAGMLDLRERIVLADFGSPPASAAVADAVTEAFRVDFEQSKAVTVVPPAFVRDALRRMQVKGTTLDESIARELSQREGIKAFVVGEVNPIGGTYVLSARLITSATGETLASFRETAADSSHIIEAVDRLSRKLRTRIGESLKSIRADEPLASVTTPSLEALRKYSQALRASDAGDRRRGIALLEEAVAIDTAFAMAYRRLSSEYFNQGFSRAAQVKNLTRAYQHRNRLTERERSLTVGTYYMLSDLDAAIVAYQSMLENYPNESFAANNLGLAYMGKRDYARSAEFYRRAVEIDSSNAVPYTNLAAAQIALGQLSEAMHSLDAFERRFPRNPTLERTRAAAAWARAEWEEVEAQLLKQREKETSPGGRARLHLALAALEATQGRLQRAETWMRTGLDESRTALPSGYLANAVELAGMYLHNEAASPQQALTKLEPPLRQVPLTAVEPINRPYLKLAQLYADAGQTARARAFLTEYEQSVPPELRELPNDEIRARGRIALAEGRVQDAIREFRTISVGLCEICDLSDLGRAFDAANNPDSAIAYYQRWLITPHPQRFQDDMHYRGPITLRLAQLYDTRGDQQNAARYYAEFVELWRDADPPLQPRVQQARARLAALANR